MPRSTSCLPSASQRSGFIAPRPCARVSSLSRSGFCAAAGGLLYSLYLLSGGYTQVGIGMELDAIAAVVIGGTLLTGGRGLVVGSLVGVLVLVVGVLAGQAGLGPRLDELADDGLGDSVVGRGGHRHHEGHQDGGRDREQRAQTTARAGTGGGDGRHPLIHRRSTRASAPDRRC